MAIFAEVTERFQSYFLSPDNQFGFKKGASCRDAIYSLLKTVEHYVNNGCTVNICAIDLSKAFDKVNHNAVI